MAVTSGAPEAAASHARTREGAPAASGLHVSLPEELVEAIAVRAAELVVERLDREAPAESPFLTVEEAASFLRSSRQRVYDLLSAGRLTRHKEGSRVLVSRAEIVAHVGGVAPALPPASRGRMDRGSAA
jgi:excisionase family DNA binding protein